MTETALRRWERMLDGWAIPDAIRSRAPRNPYFFDPAVFGAAAEEALTRGEDTASDRAARQALPAGGTVLDVGCGAGAASLRLRPARAIGVDSSEPLLELFRATAAKAGVEAVAVPGSWPEVAADVPTADVAVCHHVLYNVADLEPFVRALDSHGRRRVVVELTAEHPMAWTAPYWSALHGWSPPPGPDAADAVAALEELGLAVRQERWPRAYQMIGESRDDAAARIARRLCLPDDRVEELVRVMERQPPPVERGVVTLWWEGQSRRSSMPSQPSSRLRSATSQPR